MKAKFLLLLLPFMAGACDGTFTDEQTARGSIVILFSSWSYRQTKAAAEFVPDTADFLLCVTSEKGDTAYSGSYGDSPSSIEVRPGTWTVSVRSSDFSSPKFSSPQYGDDQTIPVSSGETAKVKLICRQVNSGIRLHIKPDFLGSFPDGAIFVSSKEGRLLYSYNERRIAYFKPGPVSVTLDENLDDEKGAKTLFTRTLSPCEILNVSISAPEGSGKTSIDDIRVDIDTTRNWSDYDFSIGNDEGRGGGGAGNGSGSSIENAMDVAGAMAAGEVEDVWVYGYIVGCFRSSRSDLSNEAPFSISTNLAIASRKSVTDKEACIAVQLPVGDVREALNLVDNESNLGKKVFLKGDLVSRYLGTVGLQRVSDFVLK